MSSTTEPPVLYRLKNFRDHHIISVSKDQFKIGRAMNNDLAIPTNRYLSSCHCIFDYTQGRVFLRDTSSNGTLINRQKKLTKTDPPIQLQEGDIIHLVFRKDEPETNLIFQLEFSTPIRSKDSTLKRKLSTSDLTDRPLSAADDTKENIDLSQILNSSSSIVETKTPATTTTETLTSKMSEDMEDVLTCVCCQDLMRDPICVEPCLHAFCSDCYSSWEAIQRTCPKCRAKVTGKKKNVMINGILEAYLKAHPHKRPVLKAASNAHSTKHVKPSSKTNQRPAYRNQVYVEDSPEEEDEDHDDEDEDEDEDEEEEEEEEEEDSHLFVIVSTGQTDDEFICRQCPSSRFANASSASVVPDGFQCHPDQNHLLCQCCVQAMPDRQGERGIHQSCELCQQYFCHLYFDKCQRSGCLGCLNQLRNLKFAPRHLTNLVNDNPVETQIVQNYLNARQMTLDDLLRECCQRLDRGEFKCPALNGNSSGTALSNKILCYRCGLTIFKELAYQFRLAMRSNDIHPPLLRHRENCYYGKQCRTQYTKPAHAQKLNHACDQTRFA